jgi:endoplasmic reticulum resident protein 44
LTSEIANHKLSDGEGDLDNILQSKDKVFILFYASWCPFSLKLLPVFERCAKDNVQNCLCVKIHDKLNLMNKYSVEVVPTVLLFKNGKVSKRLDVILRKALTERQSSSA